MFEDKMITQEELLEMSGVSRSMLYRDIRNGKIRCVKLSNKINRFYKSDAIAYSEEKKKRGRSEEWKKKLYAKQT